jgi:hypothetical protein
MKAVKRAIRVVVAFAEEAGALDTLEGVVSFVRGDALVTGPDGERWPIHRSRFEATYVPGAGMTLGQDGEYTKRPQVIEARQTESETSIELKDGQGTLRARRGDWIIESQDGQRWVVSDIIFRKTYDFES